MQMPATDCEVLALDSGIINCAVTNEEVPVVFVTIRVTGQPQPVNLAVRNPRRLAKDLPKVLRRSRVLNGGEFTPDE